MANPKHLELLQQGVDAWNAWREKEPSIRPDLTGAELFRAKLGKANLRWADLSGANLLGADLGEANLRDANLNRADLSQAFLAGADLRGADLREGMLVNACLTGADLTGTKLREACFMVADLGGAKLSEADLYGADLTEANLSEAIMVGTDLTNADLGGCHVHGVSAWGLKLSEGTRQQSLVITKRGEPRVTTDDIEVAQFLYLMLHSEKIRSFIDTITSKVVLILGRFTPARKPMLDALRDELRKRAYVPVLFDLEKSGNQTTIETVTLLARMARFVIADLSDAKSVLQELQAIVPSSPMLPVQPLVIATQDEPGMFDFFKKFPWVLKTYRYDSLEQLTADLDGQVIRPAEAKALELRGPANT